MVAGVWPWTWFGTVSSMSSDPTPVRTARPWPRALGFAAAFLYVPQLLPLLVTDLLEHGHCLETYVRFFPVLSGLGPGVNARIASGLGEPHEEYVLVAVAIAVTVTLLGGTTLAMRRRGRLGFALALVVAGLSAVLSLAAVALIRA
jgi:hypothetical protein